ncbi:CAAX protease self-immunity-domain-containing protein [Mucor mucedo]|uniref:CAAX protease self-immunity-domain-containing protein n=1 Tax=Mucor mucedo TaxID=29922 RepID=UPI00221EB54D|nr:CAAX protease self-immunity-domain-containing protein [Mucor mucedo]KAI7888675.1 CAAX protease self-immunity-domain-containing protein [Mucor mucedo]
MFFDRELPFQKHFDFHRDVVENVTTLVGQRNYMVAPLTEEFVFRSCMIAVLYQAGYSKNYLIFISPLYFGIAHLHHAWDNYNKMNRTTRALKNAILSSSFQFVYTTLFGWYASYLFLRSGNLMPPVLSHSFCNIMGFPDFSSINHRSRLQKAVIYMCFPIGIWLFIYNFQYLTHSDSIYW